MVNQLQREIDEKELLVSIIKILSDGWVSPIHFERLLNKLEIPRGAPAIYFLTGVQQVIRELPFKVFQDEHSRSAIIDAAQSALDNEIANEETNTPINREVTESLNNPISQKVIDQL
jgi:type III secretion system TyeA family effector delivery regulator